MSNHTPGPWNLQSKGPGYYVTAEGGLNVAALNAAPADAKLITAAPEMWLALSQFVDEFERGREHISSDTLDMAVRAIAKALGK